MRKKKNAGKTLAVGAVVAGIAGYAAGLLTAPKSGKETRQDLGKKAEDIRGGAEEQLQAAVDELTEKLKVAKTKSVALNAKTRKEFDETVVRAKDAQNKASQVLKAFRAGEAEDPELNKAVKQTKQAISNLAKYLKS
jgi:gas vesicle protein